VSHTPLFSVTDPDQYRRIRDVLAAANFDDEHVVGVLGLGVPITLGDKKLAPMLRRTSGATPLETLIRVFILDYPVDLAAARRALAPMTPEQWAKIGLLTLEGDSIRATVQIRCYQGLLLAFDFTRRPEGGLRHDHVMGVGGSSLMLAGLTVRRPIRAALDLGTGCGIQAFLASHHSERVVAVDRNPRAIDIASFNAHLNAIDNVRFVEGDMFAPVEGPKFDLIVSNPPFFISPDPRYLFLNAGMESDDVCRKLVGAAARHLNEGGYCIFNANWAIVDGQDWRERLTQWFEGTGCDGWVMRVRTHKPAEYADFWIDMETDNPKEFARLFAESMKYYAKRRIVGIDDGVILMRRSGGRPTWFRADDAPENFSYPCGDDVAQLFELRDFLESASGDDLMPARLRLAPNVRLEQICRAAEGSWSPEGMRVRRMSGLGYRGEIDPHGARILAACDGRTRLGELIAQLASSLRADVEKVKPGALAIVRRLIEQGFLLPAAD
jgi:precorrin-6B methylase 2